MPIPASVATRALPSVVMMARDNIIRICYDIGALGRFPVLVLLVRAAFVAVLRIGPGRVLSRGAWALRVIF